MKLNSARMARRGPRTHFAPSCGFYFECHNFITISGACHRPVVRAIYREDGLSVAGRAISALVQVNEAALKSVNGGLGTIASTHFI